MSRPTVFQQRVIALVGTLAMLAFAAPAAANTPDRMTESDTSINCQAVPNIGGVMRVAASVSSLGGVEGFLSYWADPADPALDPPTLVSQGVETVIGADGSITAIFQMYLPGDLGLEGDAEPIFVGAAELNAIVEPTGDVEQILERTQNGNGRFVQRGGRQALTVTDGAVVVPTGGTFELAGAECIGRQQVVEMFATQPNAYVATGQLIQLDCFFETATGFVVLSGQSGATETFVGALIVDGTNVFFGEAVVPELNLHGAQSSIALPMDGDPSVIASADVSASFSVVERSKEKFLTETGWAMETAYLFGVDGSLSMHGPGLSLQLPMDGCSANAQVGISHSI